MNAISNRLRELRTAKGWSLDKLALETMKLSNGKFTNIDKQTLSNYEIKGIKQVEKLGAICDALDITLYNFFNPL